MKETLEREIKSGKYGPLNYVVCRFTNDMRKFGSWGAPFRHQISDPLLIEGAVHHFDIFRALTGSNARTVYTLGWNPTWGEYAGDSTAFVTVDMLNGTRCMYEGAKANATTYNGWTQEYFRAECENATLEMDRKVIKALRGGNYYERPKEEEIPLLEQPAWSNEWISEMFCDWLDGGDPPPCHLDDELQCHALLFAAIESAHTGQPVDVQAFLQRHMEVI
jgi:predicted dehydrogenase